MSSLPQAGGKDKSELVFYIPPSRGLTQKLYDYAQKHPGSTIPVLIDGPYGGINMQRFDDPDRLLVVAGGSGTGWSLSMLELFCRQQSAPNKIDTVDQSLERASEDGHVKTHKGIPRHHRSLHVVLATRDYSSRVWFLSTVSELLARYPILHQSPNITIDVHLTGQSERTARFVVPGNEPKITSSPSDTIIVETKGDHVAAPNKAIPGRPDLPFLIHHEGEVAAAERSSLSVYVCGPVTMQNDVRNAVAKENLAVLAGSKSGGVYLHLEHFSWA